MRVFIILMILFLAGFVINVTANAVAQQNAPETGTDKITPQSLPETTEKSSAIAPVESVTSDELTVQSQPDIANEKSAQAYIKSATYAEQHGNPELARQILKEGFRETQQIDILSQWLAMDDAMFHALKQKNQRHALTHWKTKFENKCLKNRAYGGKCSEYDRQKELSTQENNAIPIADMAKVRAVLDKYKHLKNSLTDMQTILNSQGLDSINPEKVKEISHQVAALVVAVKRTRCDYLSYDVVSPYLARTEQMIFISKINKPDVGSILTLVPDNSLQKLRAIEKLREAATIFAKIAVFDMMLESESPVREQFFGIYKKFQKVDGTKFEEFKAVKTVADQLKLEAKRAATATSSCTERWWRR